MFLRLPRFVILFYASPTLGFRFGAASMHRATARLLLFFALVGTLAPSALAVTAAPHACCLRKGVHRCHDSLTSDPGLIFRDASCCNGDCGRAITTAQWAHPQPRPTVFFLPGVHASVAGIQSHSPTTAFAELRSARAPPAR